MGGVEEGGPIVARRWRGVVVVVVVVMWGGHDNI